MSATMQTTDAPEMADGRAAASLRITARLELAEILQRVIPPLISILGEEGDPDLLPTEARDAALDVMDELDALGYAIVRKPRS